MKEITRTTIQPLDQAKLVDNLVLQAFFDVYPEAQEYGDLLPQHGHFVSIQKSRAAEESDRSFPICRIFLQELGLDLKTAHKMNLRAGEIFDRYYHRVSKGRPEYTNYDRGEVYLPTEILVGLRSEDQQKRFESSKQLGFRMAEENINALAYKVNPTQIGVTQEFPLRVTLQLQVDRVATELGEFLRVKGKKRFRRAVSEFKHLFSWKSMLQEKTEFLAVGGKVLIHSIGEPLMSSKDAIGVDFDEGTVKTLSKPVKERFLTLLTDKMGLSAGEITIGAPKENQLAAERAHYYLGLEGTDLFKSHMSSRLAGLCMDSDAPELSIVYGQLVDPSDWLTLLWK